MATVHAPATPPAPHAMRPVDAAWYHMDGRSHPAMVTALALTRRPLDVQRARALVRQRLLGFERFRQRVVEHDALGTPQWEDVPDLDISQHVQHAALPAPGSIAALRSLVNDLASTPLDRRRPLWQMHVVDGVQGGSALVFRYHHCMADGLAMMAVAQRLFEVPEDAFAWTAGPASATPATPGWLEAAERVALGAGSLVADLLKWPDPPSPFKGAFSMPQRVAWSRPISLRQVKAIGEATGTKVNDVLVAAAAGALRDYLARRQGDAPSGSLRAMVPVNLRHPSRAAELGNEFGLLLLDLPIDQDDPLARLRATHERMQALKQSSEGVAMRLLFDLFGRVPKALQDVASWVFGSKCSLVFTNVIGPTRAIAFDGVPLERLMFWVPHPGDELGVGVAIMTYRGSATLSLVADAALVPDPASITRAFEREFAALRRAVAGAAAPA